MTDTPTTPLPRVEQWWPTLKQRAFGPPAQPLPHRGLIRSLVGLFWFFLALAWLGVGFAAPVNGTQHLADLAVGGWIAYYDWRVWTLRARYLFLIF